MVFEFYGQFGRGVTVRGFEGSHVLPGVAVDIGQPDFLPGIGLFACPGHDGRQGFFSG